MGVICNNVQNKTFGSLQQTTDTSTKSQYTLHTTQPPSFLTQKLPQISLISQGTPSLYQDFKKIVCQGQLMKHKVKSMYYLGQWSQAGYHYGIGILYCEGRYLYYGEFDTVPCGKGVLESIEEEYVYEGEFNYGRIFGKGKVESTKDLFMFEGQFDVKSQPTTGILTITPSSPQKTHKIHLQNYPQSPARIVYPCGRQYLGSISLQSFIPQGKGRASYPNDSYYDGSWQAGQFHGFGRFVWNDGSYYQGEYVRGKKEGRGKFRYRSGRMYEGGWGDGKMNGEGVLYDQQGKVVKKGIWREGVYQKEE